MPAIGGGLLSSIILSGLVLGLTPAAASTTSTPTSGRYIVSFTADATPEDVAAARDRAVADGARIVYDYDTALSGFAADLPDPARATLASNPKVAEVERDEVVSIDSTERDATAGLDRIDQRSRNLNGLFHYTSTGAGVRAYVIDTGVYAAHTEFGGRVEPGSSFTGSSADVDCGEGHGTHVAGLIGGATYGVAKAVTIVPVKVFSCDGSASVSTVIAGIEWATEDAKAHGGPAVLNLSAGVNKDLGAGLDEAAANAVAAGYTFVTAAGNDGHSACSQSPARVGAVITVGAVSASDRIAGFSNTGRCVDIFAPGVNVRSAGIASPTATALKDGTSMAAPYVTGVVAAYLQRDPGAGPSKVRTALLHAATRGVIKGLGPAAPNALLYNGLTVADRAPHVSAPKVSLPGENRTIGVATVPLGVSWKGGDPDGSVRSYQLQRSTDGGRHWATVALPSPAATSVRVNQAADNRLRFRVRATDDLGKRSAWSTGGNLRLVFDQRGAAKLRKTWSRSTGTGLVGGASHGSGRRGASATYHFSGSTIRLIGTTGADHGTAAVFLDGRRVATVDTYSATRRTCVVLFAKSVKAGAHTLRIVVLGRHDAAASGNRVDLDGFVVTS